MAATSATGGEAYNADGGMLTDLSTTQDAGLEAFWADGMADAPLFPPAASTFTPRVVVT